MAVQKNLDSWAAANVDRPNVHSSSTSLSSFRKKCQGNVDHFSIYFSQNIDYYESRAPRNHSKT